MSNLKHQTPQQLRSLIAWCESKRGEQDRLKQFFLEEVEKNRELAEKAGRNSHNIGQKEAWARIYLARKETGQMA